MAGVYGYLLQVLFGLLMLSAVTPMAISEERQRGSLDVLAATPLSTRTIVLGKWWGTFRLVPLLVIVPGLMTLAFATAHLVPRPRPPGTALVPGQEVRFGSRLYCAALVVATILAHGAFITSVGLALAIWISRQSRAIAISVGLFVMLAFGWPFFVIGIFRGVASVERDVAGLLTLSPIYCAGWIAFQCMFVNQLDESGACPWWATFWAVELTLGAVGILWLAIRAFDRCLSRMPERPRPPSSRSLA